MQVARRTEMITAVESRAEPLMKHRRALRSTLSGVAPPVPETQKISDQRPGNVYNATNFDTNVVIIMAALLCVLICALGINSVVRCALRCTRRMAFESPEEVAVRLANTGMKKNAVKALPTVVYGKGDSGAPTGSECPICLGEFADGENMRVLPKCNHGFHVKCIDTWLVSHSSCPTCRHSLLSIAEKRSKVATIEILATPVGAGQPASWRMQEPHSQCVETRIYRFPPPETPENAGDRAMDGCELPPVGRAAEGCSRMLAADDDREEGISPAKEGRLAVAGTSQH